MNRSEECKWETHSIRPWDMVLCDDVVWGIQQHLGSPLQNEWGPSQWILWKRRMPITQKWIKQ